MYQIMITYRFSFYSSNISKLKWILFSSIACFLILSQFPSTSFDIFFNLIDVIAQLRRFYTNSQLKYLTERIRFFVLTKPSEVRRTGGTLNGTRQSQSEKDGARIEPF